MPQTPFPAFGRVRARRSISAWRAASQGGSPASPPLTCRLSSRWPTQCLSNLLATSLPSSLSHHPPRLPHCCTSSPASHRQGGQPVIILIFPLQPLQQGFPVYRAHRNKSFPFGCCSPGFYKKRFCGHLDFGIKGTKFSWIFPLLPGCG